MCQLWVVISVILSYLLGAIPFGYLITRFLRHADIRKQGSGNPGATNVFRVVGPAPGVITLILDILKGLVSVVFISNLALRTEPCMSFVLVLLIMGAATVCGHNWTVFLKFKGGKGMATSAGVMIGLSIRIPQVAIIVGFCLGVWLLVFLLTGYVSLASIATACALPICMVVFNQPLEMIIFSVALCLFAVYRHKSNIGRLLRGEEKRMLRKSQ